MIANTTFASKMTKFWSIQLRDPVPNGKYENG
jgi:hypothetical protein